MAHSELAAVLGVAQAFGPAIKPRGILNDSPTTRTRQRGDPPKYANVERRHAWQQSRNVHGVVFITLCAPHVQMTAADFMSNRQGMKKPCKRCARAQGANR